MKPVLYVLIKTELLDNKFPSSDVIDTYHNIDIASENMSYKIMEKDILLEFLDYALVKENGKIVSYQILTVKCPFSHETPLLCKDNPYTSEILKLNTKEEKE
ncbi:MAG TPA: hypothetical protein ENG48_11990 [Candidatus Atribacteria bacterium]|nr:hypothetical protein [Candidatus Atribacteria bacterium]